MAEIIEIRSEDIKKIKDLESKTIPFKTDTGRIVHVDAEKAAAVISEAYRRKNEGYSGTYIEFKYGRYILRVYTNELPTIFESIIKILGKSAKPIAILIIARELSKRFPEIIREAGKIYIEKKKLEKGK